MTCSTIKKEIYKLAQNFQKWHKVSKKAKKLTSFGSSSKFQEMFLYQRTFSENLMPQIESQNSYGESSVSLLN